MNSRNFPNKIFNYLRWCMKIEIDFIMIHSQVIRIIICFLVHCISLVFSSDCNSFSHKQLIINIQESQNMEIETILQKYAGSQRDNLIPILENIQEEQGFISEEAIVKVSRFLKLPASKIYGVATFYDFFHFERKPVYHIRLCRGTACHVADSGNILKLLEEELKIKAGQITRDGLFKLEVVSCLGVCESAPVLKINNEFHAGINADSLKQIIEKCKKKIKEA